MALTAIPLTGRIDSNNAQAAEAFIRASIGENADAELTLDAAGLEYISSAGLRVLLRLKKEHPALSVINVSSEIYEILDMTGFTELLTVEKAYRTISIEGCEQIGRGANGAVYRMDDDNVVKVYNDPEALDDIKSEREKAKLALVLGLPTAISYEVVKVGESYGSVFELLNARSFSSILANQPDKFGWCAAEFTSLLKKIHSVVVPEGKLPRIKDTALLWAEQTKPLLPAEEGEKLVELIHSLPDDPHMIHGDYHTKNIMLQNDEVLLIDMDTLSVGDPIFELAQIFNSFIGFHELYPEGIKAFQGFDIETGKRFFGEFMKEYLDTECETKLNEVVDKARIIGYSRLISRLVRHKELDSERGRAESAHWLSELAELLRGAKTLKFSPNELIIPAERRCLPEVLLFIDERIGKMAPSDKARMQLAVAAEEIFVNISDYAYAPGHGTAKVVIFADCENKTVTVSFEDEGAPFDPLKKEDPDVGLPLSERTPGGLGIFLTKKLTDEVGYEFRDGKNILTFLKKL
ncbi:MAG: ATP-binding protein [Clostridiales bacterium]|nr:ATP-binding protein [Clostridiales bacterium]